MGYQVRLETFEGPFDLLFYLIEENKLDISTISLQKITNQYLIYLEQMDEMDLELVSEFVLMAAELLHLKTKMLLPSPKEQKTTNKPEYDLVKRLVFYKKIRSYMDILKDLEEDGHNTFFKTTEHLSNLLEKLTDKDPYDEDLLEGITIEQLQLLYNKAVSNLAIREEAIVEEKKNKRINLREFEKEIYTISEKVDQILALSQKHPKGFSFFEVLDAMKSRHEKVVSFLALLELIKLQQIRIKQDSYFAKIMVLRGSLANDR